MKERQVIFQAWMYKLNNIPVEEVKRQGFTAIQTSPLQLTKEGINTRVSIISNSPVRNKLHLKLVLCLTNYIIVTAMVKKLSKEEECNSNEYERI